MDSTDFNNFLICLDNNKSYSIPILVLGGISFISNIYLCIKLRWVSKSPLEENIELLTFIKKKENVKIDTETNTENINVTIENIPNHTKSDLPNWVIEEYNSNSKK